VNPEWMFVKHHTLLTYSRASLIFMVMINATVVLVMSV